MAAINAEQQTLKTTVTLPMLAKGTPLRLYTDNQQLQGSVKSVKANSRQQLSLTIPCNGAAVAVSE